MVSTAGQEMVQLGCGVWVWGTDWVTGCCSLASPRIRSTGGLKGA